MNQPVTVLLADEDASIRKCLKQALECECKLAVMWEADNGLQALALIQQHHPNLILIDAKMQRMSGIEATRCIRHRKCNAKIVVMGVYETDREPALAAGADAFVIKDSGRDAIRAAVHELLKCD